MLIIPDFMFEIYPPRLGNLINKKLIDMVIICYS